MDDLAPGFRFYPTEEELISFYLHNKLKEKGPRVDHVIPVVDIYDHNPWLLPQYAGVSCRGDQEQWFYFIPIQEKCARGGRPNRLTNEGYWKATGSPNYVYSSDNKIIGMKRTMVFYKGRAPNGTKTEWKMNEYLAIEAAQASSSTHTSSPLKLRQELSLCRVYIKSKSVRSFDRRPSGETMIERVRPQPQRHVNTERDHQKHPLQEKSSSRDSSSSGEHHASNSQTVESNCLWGMDHNMVLDNEPWWDLEQVNLD